MFELLAVLLWLGCFAINRKGRIHPRIGGGCFGGDPPKKEEIDIPQLPEVGDLYGEAAEFGQAQTPLAYGAREDALSDLSRGNEYYNEYQPLDFEQALGNQYFQNVWPNARDSLRHRQTMSGFDSPVFAQGEGELRGDIGYNIGKYLSDQGNTRANQSLTARMGIDPYASIMDPYVGKGITQGNNQAQLQLRGDEYNSGVRYANAMSDYNNKAASGGSIGSMIGMGLGAIAAPFTGGLSLLPAMSMGAGLGGTLGGIATGGSSPVGIGDALQIADLFGGIGGIGGLANTGKAAGMGGGGGISSLMQDPSLFSAGGFGGF